MLAALPKLEPTPPEELRSVTIKLPADVWALARAAASERRMTARNFVTMALMQSIGIGRFYNTVNGTTDPLGGTTK